MATKASSSSLSPCIRLMEESLLLPTQDVGLFAKTFLLIFAHTFLFIAVAVHFAHPLSTTILSDIKAQKTTTDTASSTIHSKELLSLLAIYISYLTSKLAVQLVTALATTTTYSGERLTRKTIKERIAGGGLLWTAALAGVLELSITVLLVALLVSTWTYADDSIIKSLCGYIIFFITLLLYIYATTVIAVSVAVAAVDRAGCHTVWAALRQAWRLMGEKRKEAAVLVFVVNLLPAFIYPAPVCAFLSVYPADEYSLYYGEGLADRFSLHDSAIRGQGVWLMGVVSGSGLPSVGAQLFSMVAATVFCCLSSMETQASDAGAGARTSV